MELSELTAYAKEKYHIEEQHKWADFPGFSVLSHPRTGKWIALLMRQWDTDSGIWIERCDLKCGIQTLREFPKSYLNAPIRMHGSKWISVAFHRETEPDMIFRLFDRAVSSDEERGYTIVLESLKSGSNSPCQDTAIPFTDTSFRAKYQDTAIPFSDTSFGPKRAAIPEKLRQMRQLYQYGRESMRDKARNFYRQGMFMQDFEDNVPWTGGFVSYYPTYQDMTTKQLRGYFTWRKDIRRGNFRPIATSAAYLYIYELLNGIGTSSPEDGLRKLKDFKTGYVDSGLGDRGMQSNLRRWMPEYAIVQGLPSEIIKEYTDPELLQKDAALMVLREPEKHSDDEIFSALCCFGAKKLLRSPVITNDPERGRHLVSEVWRTASKEYHLKEQDLFTACFGERKMYPWYPLSNAVWYQENRHKDDRLLLDECRSFICVNGMWKTEAYDELLFNRRRLANILRETDLRLRRYLKTGRYLKEKPEDAWADPFIYKVIEADEKVLIEASRPKITIDLSGLEKIRMEANATRDSLLTDEDLYEEKKYQEAISSEKHVPYGPEIREKADIPAKSTISDKTEILIEKDLPDIPLDSLQLRILRTLLEGGSAKGLIHDEHLMPSLVADRINEALFDEIGDIVLICENDELALVDDYREELVHIPGILA